MNLADFNRSVEQRGLYLQDLLTKKGDEYAPGTERFENFIAGQDFMDCSREEVLWNWLSKQLVGVRGYCTGKHPLGEDKINEKINDCLVYLLVLGAMVDDEFESIDIS